MSDLRVPFSPQQITSTDLWRQIFGPQAADAVQAPVEPPMFQVPQAGGPQFPTAVPGGGGAQFTPTPVPYAPDRTVDPSLAGREQYAQDREGRIGELVQQALSNGQRWNMWERPMWNRLLNMAAPVLNGRDGSQVLESWNQGAQELEDRALRLELGMEDERGRTAEAGFARQSGEHQVAEGNTERRYGVDVGNIQLGNQAEMYNTGEANANTRASASQQLQLSIAQYEQQAADLAQARQAILSQGGPAAFSTFGQMISPAGEEVTQQALAQQARTTLSSLISETATGAGNTINDQRRAVQQEMERIAGRELPSPPAATFRNPRALTEFYIRAGVPLDSPELLVNFGTFGAPE